jgi:acetylornithine deacetylase/succinyl-diaminopimelate desuccinylase-like protein
MNKTSCVALPSVLALALASFLANATPAGAGLPGPLPPAANQRIAHDIFRDLVEIRSVHEVGTQGTADVIVKYLKANGFTDAEIHVAPETRYPHQVNVVVRLKGKGHGKPVMWICHMDVVDARAQDWSVPPFKFTQ